MQDYQVQIHQDGEHIASHEAKGGTLTCVAQDGDRFEIRSYSNAELPKPVPYWLFALMGAAGAILAVLMIVLMNI